MKRTILFSTVALFITTQLFAVDTGCREINLHTEKVGEALHWMPNRVEVTQGEKVRFIVKHDLEGGFDFHGFYIPALKISQQVNRHKPLSLEVTIPSDIKVGEHRIGCQFHPKHVGATLVVKAATKAQGTAKKTKTKH